MTYQRQIQCKSKEISNCNIAVASETVIKRPTVKGELSVLFTLRYLLLFSHSSPFVLAIVLIDLMLEIAGLKEHFLCTPASHVPACYGKRLHSIITYYFLLVFFFFSDILAAAQTRTTPITSRKADNRKFLSYSLFQRILFCLHFQSILLSSSL